MQPTEAPSDEHAEVRIIEQRPVECEQGRDADDARHEERDEAPDTTWRRRSNGEVCASSFLHRRSRSTGDAFGDGFRMPPDHWESQRRAAVCIRDVGHIHGAHGFQARLHAQASTRHESTDRIGVGQNPFQYLQDSHRLQVKLTARHSPSCQTIL